MLKIRLQRVGRKAEPTFRLLLTDSKNSTKSGKFLEVLGNYDARKGEQSVFKADRITYWMSVGAQVSPTVHNLLIDKKVISGKKVNNLPLKKAIVKDAPIDTTPSTGGVVEEKTTTEEKVANAEGDLTVGEATTAPVAEAVA
jgi:small subunit ribosomal protein S16